MGTVVRFPVHEVPPSDQPPGDTVPTNVKRAYRALLNELEEIAHAIDRTPRVTAGEERLFREASTLGEAIVRLGDHILGDGFSTKIASGKSFVESCETSSS
jgi:hypothetical protein